MTTRTQKNKNINLDDIPTEPNSTTESQNDFNLQENLNNWNANLSSAMNQYGQLPKSRNIYLLLACFLGYFGIHNFYIERFQRGLVQLILSIVGITLPVVWVWILIDMLTVKTDAREKLLSPINIWGTLAIILFVCSAIPIIFAVSFLGMLAVNLISDITNPQYQQLQTPYSQPTPIIQEQITNDSLVVE